MILWKTYFRVKQHISQIVSRFNEHVEENSSIGDMLNILEENMDVMQQQVSYIIPRKRTLIQMFFMIFHPLCIKSYK